MDHIFNHKKGVPQSTGRNGNGIGGLQPGFSGFIDKGKGAGNGKSLSEPIVKLE